MGNNEKYKNMEMLTGNGNINQNVESMREQFIEKYCKSKNWDSSNLTTEQLAEIKSKPEYKNPSMICG